jgi:hypothetical protein
VPGPGHRSERSEQSEVIEWAPKEELERAQRQIERQQREMERLKQQIEHLRKELEAAPLFVPASTNHDSPNGLPPASAGRWAAKAWQEAK